MTRYPKQGKSRKWTIKELQAIDRTWRGDTISDGDGLSGEVRVASDDTVTVRFKYAYKSDGKVSWHQCGTWPVRTLESIRAERDQARLQLKQGVDPSDKRKADRLQAQAQVQAVIAEAARSEAEKVRSDALGRLRTFIVPCPEHLKLTIGEEAKCPVPFSSGEHPVDKHRNLKLAELHNGVAAAEGAVEPAGGIPEEVGHMALHACHCEIQAGPF